MVMRFVTAFCTFAKAHGLADGIGGHRADVCRLMVVFFAASGFVLTNLNDGNVARRTDNPDLTGPERSADLRQPGRAPEGRDRGMRSACEPIKFPMVAVCDARCGARSGVLDELHNPRTTLVVGMDNYQTRANSLIVRAKLLGSRLN
jgi:hypothetical protein